MKVFWESLCVLALLAVSSQAVRAAPGDLQGTVLVSGREAEVRLRQADGRPAAGVQLRLLFAGKLAVAAGRTDSQGRWSTTVGRTGLYDVLVEGGSNSTESLRLPFTVLDTPPDRPIPWLPALAGLVCLVGALGQFLLRSWPGVHRGLVPLRLVLCMAGFGLLGWSAWQRWLEPSAPAAPADPDVAEAARAFLRDHKVKPLSAPLERLLTDKTKRIKTQTHPLLGQPAPSFDLKNAREQVSSLREYIHRGPVVLVFYYGYYCNHCVGQLFALHDDIAKFRELGAEVIAVSADPPELTRQRFRQYGDFAFPVLSDTGNKIAQIYGVYRPAAGEKAEDQQHGTFVIARDGRVHWVHCGYEPFTGNLTLLYELARLEGRLPIRKGD